MKIDKIKDFPITPYLNDICKTLKESPSRSLVLTAETAAGKSTVLPLALLEAFDGKIIMLEPRRLAVLNICNRVAELIEEEPGDSCGYVMHMDRKVSAKTRFTVVTDAVLTRIMQADPMLEGVNVVVIDEFHERSVQGDLALAFLKEVMELREDLYVIVMSATIDTGPISKYLGNAPVVCVPGRTYDVKLVYKPNVEVSKAIRDELLTNDSYSNGAILVFLPGIKEIRRVKEDLEALNVDAEVLILHSSVSMEDQRKVLVPSKNETKRRVILSSAIAETSLTIPDITVVIDSGLCRMNDYNLRTGMNSLVTRTVCNFDAKQRAGRAGRIQEGKCIRLWNEHDMLLEEKTPEITRCDLSGVVLECLSWGTATYEGISWLTEPGKSAWNASLKYLELLGCVKGNSITELGRACLSLGVDYRIATCALSGLPFEKEEFSTEFACNLIPDLDKGSKALYLQGLELKRRVQIYKKNNSLYSCFPQEFENFSTTYALCCGFPDRIGVLEKGTDEYRFYSGKVAKLIDCKGCLPNAIVAVESDGGTGVGKIYKWEALDERVLYKFLESRCVIVTEASFKGKGENRKIQRLEKKCFGKIVLSCKDVPVSEEDYSNAWMTEVKENGLECLSFSEETKRFLIRVKFYTDHTQTTDSLEIRKKYEGLRETPEEWLKPFMTSGINKGISETTVKNALYWYLEKEKIDIEVPEMLLLENGKKRKIVYEEQNGEVIPVLEVIIQHVFGCFTTPRVCGEKVLLRLLSPARRPLQVTRDLENFWANSWPEICSEMKGRYPKHNWNYRVADDD